MNLLIDECLHTSLVDVARRRGHQATHVVWVGLGGYKDWSLMEPIRSQSFTFVTNNAKHFRRLYEREPLHAGLIVIVPNVEPRLQHMLLDAALDEAEGARDLMNKVIEMSLIGNEIWLDRYDLFKAST